MRVRRRSALHTLAAVSAGVLLGACGLSSLATGSKIPRVLVVAPAGGTVRDQLAEALSRVGYVEGRTIAVESRLAPEPDEVGSADLASSLAQSPPDVIVAVNTSTALAVKRVTSTIPIVAISVTTPIESGLVVSLARPGGNLTAVAMTAPGQYAKWLDLLREVLPNLRRVAVLVDRTNQGNMAGWGEVRLAAEHAGIMTQPFELASADDTEAAIKAMAVSPPDAVLDLASPLLLHLPPRVLALASQQRPLPSVTLVRELVVAGFLIRYGPSNPDGFSRAAAYVDKILKGARAGELPVEQPREFELVVNLKTARLLGITIPPDLARQVTEWIE